MNETVAQIEKELNRVNAEIEELDRKGGTSSENRAELATWEKKRDGLIQRKTDAEEKAEQIRKDLEVARKAVVTDVEKDKVFEINSYSIRLPGGGGQLEQLLRAYCVNLSNFNNPFVKTYTDAQKKELIQSITGNWINDDGTGNTPYTFSWFHKWWQHFSDYADNYVVYETPQKINEVKDSFVDTREVLRGVTLGLKNKDIAAYIKKVKGEAGYSKENRAQKYLYNKNRELKALVPYPVQAHVLSSEGRFGSEAHFLSSDFMHFMNITFSKDLFNSNLLLNRGNGGTDYTLEKNGPTWIKSANFDNLAFFRWYEPTTSNLNKDHKEHAWKEAMSTLVIDHNNNSGVIGENNPIKIRVGNDIKGFFNSFHEIFVPNVQNKYIFLHHLRSVAPGANINIGGSSSMQNPSKDSDYLIARKLTSSAFSPGEIEVDDLGDIDKEIADAQNKIDRLKANVEVSEEERKQIAERKKYLHLQQKKLSDKLRSIKGTSEADLYRKVISAANQIASGSKQTLIFYLDYLEDFKQLSEAKKENLKNENKITETEYKTWSLLNCAADEKDIVRKKANLDKMREAHDLVDKESPQGIKQKVQALQGNYFILANRIKPNQKPKDFLDEWLKENNDRNAKLAQKVMEDLTALKEIIILTPIQEDVLEAIKKTDLLPKDLEGILKNIVGTSWNSQILSRFKTYAYPGVNYGEENNFSELISIPGDLRGSDKFKTFLTGKGFPEFPKWIEKEEDMFKIIATILEYRIREYTKKTNSERESDYKGKLEKVLGWFNEAPLYGINLKTTTEDGKNAEDAKNSLAKKLGKERGEVIGLDPNNERDLNIILKWKDYSPEEMREIFTGVEDKSQEARNKEPNQIHKEHIDRQIKETGITTTEAVSQVKQGDKEGVAKLDKLETVLEKGEEKGVLTEEHKKMKAAITAHKATFKPGETKPPVTGGDKDDATTGTGTGTGTGTTDDKKPGGTTTTKPEEKPLWKKAFGAIIWGPILVIGAIVAIWYFAFRKPEGSEGEETPEGEVTE